MIITVNNPEWGTAGDCVEDAIVGKEYPIWQQAQPGYYFTGWIYSPTILDNPLTLNSSIIVPEETVTVTAFFSPVTDFYDVTIRIDPPEGGTIVKDIPEQAAPGQKFDVEVKVNDGYIFEHWYYIDEDGNKVIVSTDPATTITMPAHPIDLVASVKKAGEYKLYVTANNSVWGQAWTTLDNSDERVWERLAVEGEEYPINVQANAGYEFVEFVYKPQMENPLENEGKIVMPAHDITVTAIFREIAPEFSNEPYNNAT